MIAETVTQNARASIKSQRILIEIFLLNRRIDSPPVVYEVARDLRVALFPDREYSHSTVVLS